jgi:hypothetical protein
MTMIHYTITDSLRVNRASYGLEALDQCVLLLYRGMTIVDKAHSWQYHYLTYVAPSGMSVNLIQVRR